MKCIYCSTEITKKSEEHIIPQSIGGKLTTFTVCEECNHELGNKLDKELSNLTKIASAMLNVHRDRGKSPGIQLTEKETNEPYVLKSKKGLKSASDILKIGDNEYKIYYNNEIDLEKKLKILNKKGNKNLILNGESQYQDNPKFEFMFSTGNYKALRSIAKIAYEAYLHFGGNIIWVKHLISYIKGYSAGYIVFPNYNEYPAVEDFWDNKPTHSILIYGKTEIRQLIAQISLFDTWRYIVILNDNYLGENVLITFIQNIEGEIQENKIEYKNIIFPPEIEKDNLQYITPKNTLILQSYSYRLQRLFAYENIKSKIGTRLYTDILNYKKGTIITKEIAMDISKNSISNFRSEVIDFNNSRFQT
ncbi:HNH endonuclease [Leptospira ellinghausenii]|uniref:HNH endonuclease n=1 Tax=Leptospira ellinghausenii TaxID=1917822 RepID=A0A2P2DJ44_9LEPT|nr:HNH endonuclease [Leptospira ellinghausenii]GBF44601.1 HNH endonuclease [Leptospira ellinghausenii]